MTGASTPVEIFCSYAHADETWRRKLETHLSLLKRQGLISLWHDRLIAPGTDWDKTIDTHLETASVILLLVSADFLASDYCYGVEMTRALERQEAGEARVIPILVRPVDKNNAPFAHLQALPTDAKPLATWRNQETALADVAAGIRRAIEELPQLAVSTPRAVLPAAWNIPYPRNPFFLGRDDELSRLRSHLQAGQAIALSQPQAISGLGGIGKTQLALEYAYRFAQDYQAVLWARAESTVALVSSYIAITTLLHLPEREAKEQDIAVQAVKIWLQAHRGWLLILDNADELALLPDFLPPAPGGHLLLTTRAAATGRLAHRLEIETLLPEQGALFLLRRAGLIAPDAALSQASAQERELAVQISQEFGGLPLALDQAGAYLEETGTDLVSYWHIYQQHRADLLQQRGGLVADHPAPVATTWSLSFQRVEEKNSAAADLLRVCAYLAPDAIPEEILIAGASQLGPVLAPVAADAFLLSQAIEALRAYSLVRRDPREKTISVHRLVQAVLQDTLEKAERRSWAERAMHAVSATFPSPVPDAWPQCERLLPQAFIVAQVIERYQIIGEKAGHLLNETAAYLYARARYVEAGLLFQQGLRFWEQQEGYLEEFKHSIAAARLKLMGISDLELDRIAEEQRLSQLAGSLANLGNLYYQQGRYTEAEPLLQRAVQILEQQVKQAQQAQLRSSDLPVAERAVVADFLAIPLMSLGDLYYQQGKYVKAEPLFLRALSIWERHLGPEHPYTAYPLNSLGNLYYQQGKYAEAEPLFLRALHIREQAEGPQHSETAETMHDLARLREALGNREEARVWYGRALSVYQQVLGVHHPKTTGTRERFIALLHAMGQHEEAAQLEAAQIEP